MLKKYHEILKGNKTSRITVELNKLLKINIHFSEIYNYSNETYINCYIKNQVFDCVIDNFKYVQNIDNTYNSIKYDNEIIIKDESFIHNFGIVNDSIKIVFYSLEKIIIEQELYSLFAAYYGDKLKIGRVKLLTKYGRVISEIVPVFDTLHIYFNNEKVLRFAHKNNMINEIEELIMRILDEQDKLNIVKKEDVKFKYYNIKRNLVIRI